ncbi:MAG TPA: EAL domain-containing protein [Solirubrobacterales bacterium]|nr:EAL domain-containing protein [Solirubrobacterales bacterium]
MSVGETQSIRSGARNGTDAMPSASIADYLSDMVSTHAPDGTYRYVSPASKDLLGYRPDELVGTSAYEYFHPDDRAKIGIAHRSARQGAPFTIAYRLRRKDNEFIWVETTTRVLTDEASGEVKEIVCSTRQLQQERTFERLTSAEHRATLDRVQRVLEEEQVRLVYQPIFDLETEEVIAYEALARFPGDPARGPDRWFSEAWDIGLGVPLELLAVREAARALPELPDDVTLCVNASPPTIFAPPFLSCFGRDANRVTVELTEHLQIDDYDGFAARLHPLREAGGQVAIDDFGAGYASLRHVLKVRPEWIKLDISLTERIDENPVAHALASSLVSFAEEVGVRVVAEGIETEDELDALREIGFRYGQGFYLGTPGPLGEALAAA